MPEKLLKNIFGYKSFRPLQKEIIETVLKKKDAVVVMPTGGGKSLCYQIPAILKEGLTVVISPLISLMYDQVKILKSKGVQAEFWNSTLTINQITDIQNRLKVGEVKILYISPERFNDGFFCMFLQKLNISLFAIDEADCISNWGHDFRPDYRNLYILKKYFKGVPILALTATATEYVVQDIKKQLKIENALDYKISFDRKNLYYEVRPKKNTYEQITKFINDRAGESGIIYCLSRDTVDRLSKKMSEEGVSNCIYHAGLTIEERHQNQQDFFSGKIPIMIATIAFGMGIDKSDIRFVIHYDMPKSLETYYQETGRAGRDGEKAECLFFFSYSNRRSYEYFLDEIQDNKERERLEGKLDYVINFAGRHMCRRKVLLEYLGENYEQENCGNCDVCIYPKEYFDYTELALKIFSTIFKTNEGFGMTATCDILKGKLSKKLIGYKIENLSVFGIVKNVTKEEISFVMRQLMHEGFINRKNDVLVLESKSKSFLKKKKIIMLPKFEKK